jgi:hypothetical protein
MIGVEALSFASPEAGLRRFTLRFGDGLPEGSGSVVYAADGHDGKADEVAYRVSLP